MTPIEPAAKHLMTAGVPPETPIATLCASWQNAQSEGEEFILFYYIFELVATDDALEARLVPTGTQMLLGD